MTTQSTSEANTTQPTSETTSISRPDHRPAVPGSALAIVAAVAAIALVVDTPAQWRALLVEVAGLATVTAGYVGIVRGRRVIGVLTAVAGASVVALGIGLALAGPAAIVHRLELLPGMVGLAVLLAGLLPVREGRERTLVGAGTALVFLGVATSGVVRGATLFQLFAAGVATVLAWDLGEQAISLGRQVGRGARTHRAELAHAGGTAVAGAAVLLATLGVYRIDVRGLSLAALAVLLVGSFALAASLRH